MGRVIDNTLKRLGFWEDAYLPGKNLETTPSNGNLAHDTAKKAALYPAPLSIC